MAKKVWSSVLLIVLVVAVVLFELGIPQKLIHNATKPDITSDQISGKLTEISEYATLEYYYTNIGKFEEQGDFYGRKIPLSTKSFIITYDGVMKMGILGEDINVAVKENQIIVHMPPAEILSHEIKNDTMEVFDQTRNIFNPIKIEDYNAFYSDNKKEMEDKVIKNGLLKEAEERAEQQLTLFISNIAGDYEIIFES
ncbi:MAG: DUF4230 domain-containing protein [Clostridiaceae bacterium]|nr:DUF4230 domain-containing protein [Clostridiaceae bacterium]